MIDNELMVMIDIETLDVRPTSHILQIAAIPFYFTEGYTVDSLLTVTNEFHAFLGLEDQKRSVGLGTIKFWMDNAETFKVITSKADGTLRNCLDSFRRYLINVNPAYYVSYGSHFDFPILDDAFIQHGWSPLFYRQIMDLRTLSNVLQIGKVTDERLQTHNAYHDCIAQIMMMQEVYKKLRSGPQKSGD